LAYTAASRRIDHDRRAEDEQRHAALRAAEEQHWWEVLLWVYDNIDTKDPAKILRVCRALREQARNDGQRAMLAAIVQEHLDRQAMWAKIVAEEAPAAAVLPGARRPSAIGGESSARRRPKPSAGGRYVRSSARMLPEESIEEVRAPMTDETRSGFERLLEQLGPDGPDER
jgi:hypothetical protein